MSKSLPTLRYILLLFIIVLIHSCKKEEPQPQPRPLPTAVFTWSNVGDGVVQFDNLSKESDSYSWNFGDGTGSSSEKSPTHEYSANKAYTVNLTVKNASGENSSSQQITVSSIPAPKIDFVANLGKNGEVTFVNSTTGATSYAWDFGDGTTSSLLTPTKTYTDNKSYTIRLTALGKGGSSFLEKIIIVNTVLHTSDFTYSITDGNIKFTNKSIKADSYRWEFGDGGTSTEFSPTYKYSKTGTYSVRLTVKGIGGEAVKQSTIQITSIKVTLADVVDDPIWINYLSGTWGNYTRGTGERFSNDNYDFSPANDKMTYRSFYNSYQYISSTQSLKLDYTIKIEKNILYTKLSFSTTWEKYARIQRVSDDEMVLFLIVETQNSYSEYSGVLFTKVNSIEQPSSRVIASQSTVSLLTGIWDQGNYSIYKNVFFDFSSGKNFYQYNSEFQGAKEITKYEFKVDANNVMSYRQWNSDFDPSWKKYKVDFTSNTTMKFYNINADGKISSSPSYVLTKRN